MVPIILDKLCEVLALKTFSVEEFSFSTSNCIAGFIDNLLIDGVINRLYVLSVAGCREFGGYCLYFSYLLI